MRSLGSYREYYARWSLVWEAQALLRATPLAGDEDLGRAFLDLVDPIRWPAGGLDPAHLREVRTLKARMEAERLPRGADRKTHFKLGHGGLSDVEWVAQLVQLRHAAEHPGLRTTSTTEALAAAEAAGLVDPANAEALTAAWRLASSMRNAGVLFRGKAVDAVPDATAATPTASPASSGCRPAPARTWRSGTGGWPAARAPRSSTSSTASDAAAASRPPDGCGPPGTART